MKNPLHYQLSEYDCGPTAMLDAISYLFDREEILPEIIRNVMLYCLDCYGSEGIPGKSGTSRAAMMFLSNWLNGFGEIRNLPVSSQYLSGKSVYLGSESLINDALHRGGAVVVRLYLDEPHYVLLTGEQDGVVEMFDPYYRAESFSDGALQMVADHQTEYNRIIPVRYLEKTVQDVYAFGPVEGREAIILFNDETVLTEDKTVEYII